MMVLLWGSLPILAIGLWAGWRAWRGRPVRRYALNLAIALLLLLYFLATAGLGIFWVANQELPVFDLHYLFGYLTLLLVACHVAINWKPILGYFRRHAPKSAVTPDGREWRPSVGLAGRLLALLAYGGLCYWIGLGQGSTRLVVEEGEEVPRPEHRMPAVDSALPQPKAVRQQLVTEGDTKRSLADYYHARSKHSPKSIAEKGSSLDWDRRKDPFKVYPDAPFVALPKTRAPLSVSTGAAIRGLRTRRAEGLKPGPVSLEQLSTLLHLTNGLTGITKYPHVTHHLRAAPSAGALYPTLTYVLARSVEGLAPGLYHFDVRRNGLSRLVEGDRVLEQVAETAYRPELVRGASLTLIFTTEYYRSAWKYDERSWRYSLLDAGHLASQAMLVGEALGWASRPIGRFDDRRLNAALDLKPSEEAALLLLPFGQASPKPAAEIGQPAFASRPLALQNDDIPDVITLLQGRTCLERADERVAAFTEPRPVRNDAGKEPAALPREERADEDALDAVILRRRSARRWAEGDLPLASLSTVLHQAFGAEGGRVDPSIEGNHSLRLYVVAQAVEGLAPGVYAYRRQSHSLARISSGNRQADTYAASLYQKVVREAAAVLVKTIDARGLKYPDGARGYRYASMDAGLMGGRIYLSTTALGLGVTGIGAFFDDPISDIIEVPAEREHVIYLSAIGARSPDG